MWHDCIFISFTYAILFFPRPYVLRILDEILEFLNNNHATKDVGLKEAIDEDDNIIISYSTLRSLFPPQLKKCRQDTRSGVVANFAYMPKLYIHHYYHGKIFQNDQNRRSGEKEDRIYETYKNTVMPHGRHIYAKEYDMAKSTMCA